MSLDEIQTTFNKYIDLLKDRTIYPIYKLGIYKSCTATSLLLFSTISSLSKLVCPIEWYSDVKYNDKNIFCYFLKQMMGGNYRKYSNSVYKLRNDLVNTGVNVGTFLDREELSRDKHLLKINDKYLWFNTIQFYKDTKHVISRIENNVYRRGQLYYNAQKRLRLNRIRSDGRSDIECLKGKRNAVD